MAGFGKSWRSRSSGMMTESVPGPDRRTTCQDDSDRRDRDPGQVAHTFPSDCREIDPASGRHRQPSRLQWPCWPMFLSTDRDPTGLSRD